MPPMAHTRVCSVSLNLTSPGTWGESGHHVLCPYRVLAARDGTIVTQESRVEIHSEKRVVSESSNGRVRRRERRARSLLYGLTAKTPGGKT